MHRETRFSCDPDDLRGAAVIESAPTQSISALCSTAADLAVMQMLRLTLGLGTDVRNTLLEYNAYRCRTVLSPLVRNPDCAAEHRGWVVAPSPRALDRCSLAELAASAGVPRGRVHEAAFMVGEQRFYESGVCTEGHEQPLGRFLAGPTTGEPCGICRGPIWPRPFDSHRPVPGSALGEAGQRPIGEIADDPVTWVLIRDPRQATMFRDRRLPTPPRCGRAGRDEPPGNDSPHVESTRYESTRRSGAST
jgi:hypothetical protein